MKCPLCREADLSLVYEVQDIPVFQNKVYTTEEAAQNAKTANISLMLCNLCRFIFNADFDPDIMDYDTQYQNEQAHSPYFQNYLDDILALFADKNFHKKKIIEIGCGKGYFLEKLQKHGFQVTGFDPAYEGNNPHIIKDYFSDTYAYLNADVIILRHTLEHIQNPLNFLHSIAAAVGYKGMIFVEVPRIEWILHKMAFWDIFYEHCNYFSSDSLGSIFQKSEQGFLFSGQYMYLLSDLSDLREQAKPDITSHLLNVSTSQLQKQLNFYQGFVLDHPGMLIWGAGAKGVTFVNLMDPDRKHISCVIDINPKKQNQYIAKTGHKIISPDRLNDLRGRDILVMNENYYEEIKKDAEKLNGKIYALGVNQ